MEGGEMESPEPALIPAISSGFEPLERGKGERRGGGRRGGDGKERSGKRENRRDKRACGGEV